MKNNENTSKKGKQHNDNVDKKLKVEENVIHYFRVCWHLKQSDMRKNIKAFHHK